MRRMFTFKRLSSRYQLFNGFTNINANQRQASDDEDNPEVDARSNTPQNSSPNRASTPVINPVERQSKVTDTTTAPTTTTNTTAPTATAATTTTTTTPTATASSSSPDVTEAPIGVDESSVQTEAVDQDNFDTGASVIREWIQHWSVNPEGKILFYWKGILTLTVIYNCAVVIMRTAFEEMRDEKVFSWLDCIGDFVYLADIFIDSKTSYLQNGCVIRDSRHMLRNYLSKKHVINDLVAVLPTQIVYTIVTVFFQLIGSEAISGSLPGKFFQSYQPVLRLNRLVKCHAMNKFFHKTESRTNSPNRLRAFRLVLQLALVIHWIACLYYMMSQYEGHGSTEWTYPAGPGYDRFYRKYIICMYWSTMTLTTIGERPSPSTDLEYVFTGFTFMVGVFVFATVVGNVGDVISNINAARRDFQARMDQIKFFLNHRNVPDHLQTRIKRLAEYTWDRTKAIDEQSVLQLLPDRIRTEVAIHVHLNILKKVSIFDECEEGLLRELVLKLRPQIVSPGDYICRIGEIGREMYIINHGQVEILFPDSETNSMRCVAVMYPGNFFGEISLLKLDDGQNKRTADVRSVGFSELLCLSRRDLMLVLTEYPEAKRILEEYAKERFCQTKKHAEETDESYDGSRRGSSGAPGSPMTSASQVFARVMKREGFSRLLKRKDTDLMAIKTALEELKANKSAIQDMESALLERNIQLQEAYAHISYLNSVNIRLSQSIASVGSEANASHHHAHAVLPDFQWPDIRHPNTFPNPDSDQCLSHSDEQVDNKTPTRKIDGDFNASYNPVGHLPVPALEDVSGVLLSVPPIESDDLCQLRRSSFRCFGHQQARMSSDLLATCLTANTSYGSSENEDDSDTDMDTLERKFDEIGKSKSSFDLDLDWNRRLSLPKMPPQPGYEYHRSRWKRRSETMFGDFQSLFAHQIHSSNKSKSSMSFCKQLSRSLTTLNSLSGADHESQKRSNPESVMVNDSLGPPYNGASATSITTGRPPHSPPETASGSVPVPSCTDTTVAMSSTETEKGSSRKPGLSRHSSTAI